MGLDVSHDAFHAPYSAFARWRRALAQAAGGEMTADAEKPGMAWYTYEEDVFHTVDQEFGFRELMGHSDCDGEIPPEVCACVADALTHLLPNVSNEMPGAHGLSMREITEQFIEGCRAAYEAGEPLEFG